MVELRWVIPEGTSTKSPELQWRVHLPVSDAYGSLTVFGDWTEWKAVPTAVIPAAEVKPCAPNCVKSPR